MIEFVFRKWFPVKENNILARFGKWGDMRRWTPLYQTRWGIGRSDRQV